MTYLNLKKGDIIPGTEFYSVTGADIATTEEFVGKLRGKTTTIGRVNEVGRTTLSHLRAYKLECGLYTAFAESQKSGEPVSTRVLGLDWVDVDDEQVLNSSPLNPLTEESARFPHLEVEGRVLKNVGERLVTGTYNGLNYTVSLQDGKASGFSIGYSSDKEGLQLTYDGSFSAQLHRRNSVRFSMTFDNEGKLGEVKTQEFDANKMLQVPLCVATLLTFQHTDVKPTLAEIIAIEAIKGFKCADGTLDYQTTLTNLLAGLCSDKFGALEFR